MVILREPVTDQEFADYFDLRWRILRAPLNQPRGSERDALEAQSFHIMAVNGDRLVGVGRLQAENKRQGRIRYMAVEQGFERRGVGSLILHALEDRARDLQFMSIWLNARDDACEFYERHGYRIIGRGETLFDNLHHYRMEKAL